MFKIVTPGSVVVEGRFMSIDRGSSECFINFIDGTTVRVSSEHNPGGFSRIMTAITAVADSSKLMNAELNFITGRVILNSAPTVKKPSVPKPAATSTPNNKEVAEAPKNLKVKTATTKTDAAEKKSKLPPIGVKKRNLA